MEGVNNKKIPPTPPLQGGQIGRWQKIAAAALAIFAVLAIGMWMVQFKKSIQSPLARKSGGNAKVETQNIASLQDENNDEALKNKDTDVDGLSDYDELNIYKTSPYLEDSDSDGFSDKQEIDNGKDPNCPAGRDCYRSGVVEGDKAVTSEGEKNKQQVNDSLTNLLNQTGTALPSAGGQQETGAGGSAAAESLLGGSLDAPTLRQMLLNAGMQKEALDKISDAELMKSYSEVSNK